MARRLDRALRLLGGRRLLARREGDDVDNALSEQFDAWLQVRGRVRGRARGRARGRGRGRGRGSLLIEQLLLSYPYPSSCSIRLP